MNKKKTEKEITGVSQIKEKSQGSERERKMIGEI